ncbi:uncharacterized protein NFIA_095610 [Aspergillus fischeri NRRL 181]|uniref:Uncharacterized protein n=1 Tax=Neosartorya fischeri (strain ATCC 1020 / DSM 3700 / CBS 544.65 / FGSC A1164 / JCM 1740 / NRRL 181 / WB 181) TaxID=331117 RepID=A1DAQ1_NEOFI|nr:uncharacterized protein NFIA_095610 [Aspergillus fischeri NRRL 181]EAW19941.1 predicted protein [Aspergillus fischeri NRRL 181]
MLESQVSQQSPASAYTPIDVRKTFCKAYYWDAYVENFIIGSSKLNEHGNAAHLPLERNQVPSLCRVQSTPISLTLVGATRSAYYARSALSMAASVQATQSTEINIKTTEQGPRVLNNAISTMLIIQQFFSGEQ